MSWQNSSPLGTSKVQETEGKQQEEAGMKPQKVQNGKQRVDKTDLNTQGGQVTKTQVKLIRTIKNAVTDKKGHRFCHCPAPSGDQSPFIHVGEAKVSTVQL